MRKIAIMKCYGAYIRGDSGGYYGDDGSGYSTHELIAQHVTEFTEVSHEDFEILRKQLAGLSNATHSFVIVEQIEDPDKFIQKTVADYQKLLKARQDAAAAAQAKYEQEKREREEKKLLKKQKTKKQQLEALASELGVKIVAEQ